MTKLSLTIKIDDVTSGRRIVNPHGLFFAGGSGANGLIMVWLVFYTHNIYLIDRCSPTFFGLSKMLMCHIHCTCLWVSLDVAHPTELT